MELICNETNQIRDPTYFDRDRNKSFEKLLKPLNNSVAKIVKVTEDYHYIVDRFKFAGDYIIMTRHKISKDSNSIPEWMKQETIL